MPELPDVEVLRRYVDATSLHRPIEHVVVSDELVEDVAAEVVRRRLCGFELSATRRHGKHLFVASSGGGWLRLHFGMTGTLQAWHTAAASPAHTRLRLDFGDGSHLAYVNQRKLGAVSWVDSVAAFVEQQQLGPDPLVDDLDRGAFAGLIGSRRGSVKSALMNQHVLAGLGNVYVDEILFQAGIHPRSPAGQLADDDLDELYAAMGRVVTEAVAHGADVERLPRGWLLPNREPDAACPRCEEGRIARTTVSGRSTYYCPQHQQPAGQRPERG